MKLYTVREVRDGIPKDAGLYAFTEGDTFVVQSGQSTSILRGALAEWVRSHLVNVAEEDATLTATPGGAQIAGANGTAFTADGWPSGPSVPTPDLPRMPTSLEDWRNAIANAPAAEIPPLEPIAAGETPGDYGARVLTPLGITIAQVANAGRLAEIARDADHPEWAVILAAAGVTRQIAAAEVPTVPAPAPAPDMQLPA